MGQAELWRMKEIAYIHSVIPDDTPVIVAGDFNAPPVMASAAYLTDRGFIDSFAAVNPDHAKHVTWRWRYKGMDWRYRLDYIFSSRDMLPCTSRIIVSNASDHYLVLTGFRWPETPKPANRQKQ
jgi:endonuclease/exonuclease/phosphatase family metal-dependent hydrolase